MEERSGQRRSTEEGAGEGPAVEAESGDVTVGELLELAQELGLLGTCACHRVEMAWPDGICLHCLVMATRRAYGRAVLWAVYKTEATAGGIDWEPGQRERFRAWLVRVQERARSEEARREVARDLEKWLKGSMWHRVLGAG